MYAVLVLLLTIILPIGSAVIDMIGLFGEFPPLHSAIPLLGKWYVLWAGGVRLFLAGLRQVFQPAWTLKAIFEIESADAKPIVRELGFANLAIGALCMFTVMDLRLLIAGAVVSGLYYAMAGLRHATDRHRNFNQNLAMLTDLLVAAILAAFVAMTVRGG